jgi:phosphatidylserine synthase
MAFGTHRSDSPHTGLYVRLATCHPHAVNLGGSKPKSFRAHTRRKMPAWMTIVLIVPLFPGLVFARYGLGWAAAELAALIACLLPILLVKPVTWRRGPRWTFPFWVFTMTIVFFAWAALTAGLWLRPWLCLTVSFCAGMLIIAGVWPAQKRFYRVQRQLLDVEREHRKSASSDGTTSR